MDNELPARAAVADAPPAGTPSLADAPRVVTPSQLALYGDCPRRYAFRCVERVPAEFHPAAFAFGHGLHAAVEDACAQPRCSAPDLDRAQHRFLQVFRRECAENPVRFDEGDSAERAERLGLQLVAAILQNLPFEEVAEAEVSFEVPLGHLLRARPPVVLRGRFDLRFHDGSVGELKTTKRALLLPVLRKSLQLRAYVLAAGVREGVFPLIRLIQLRKDGIEQPFSVVELHFALPDLSDLVRAIERMLAALDRRAFPRRVGPLCRWCEYQGRCLGVGPAS